MERRGLLLAIASAATADQAAAQQPSTIALGNAPPGQLPAGFRTARTGKGAPAAWGVVEDSSVPSGKVLAQTSTDQTDYRFPLAVYDGITAKDVEVSVRFKAVGGRIDRAGGIAVRLADPDNYYVLRANALERPVRGEGASRCPGSGDHRSCVGATRVKTRRGARSAVRSCALRFRGPPQQTATARRGLLGHSPREWRLAGRTGFH